MSVTKRFIPGHVRVSCGYCGRYSGVVNTHSDGMWHYYECNLCKAKFRRKIPF